MNFCSKWENAETWWWEIATFAGAPHRLLNNQREILVSSHLCFFYPPGRETWVLSMQASKVVYCWTLSHHCYNFCKNYCFPANVPIISHPPSSPSTSWLAMASKLLWEYLQTCVLSRRRQSSNRLGCYQRIGNRDKSWFLRTWFNLSTGTCIDIGDKLGLTISKWNQNSKFVSLLGLTS